MTSFLRIIAVATAIVVLALTLAFRPAHAQPSVDCPSSGMNGGMMGSEMRMHGVADEAYMQSMMSMHQGMRAQTYTGDPDHDFMVMMIPHHQAAIDMAKTELRYGKNPKLRAMAQSIINAQQAEIEQMRAMLR